MVGINLNKAQHSMIVIFTSITFLLNARVSVTHRRVVVTSSSSFIIITRNSDTVLNGDSSLKEKSDFASEDQSYL